MALLSRMIRTVAITGRTDTINTWFATRQGGRWAEQTISAAFPAQAARSASPPVDKPPAADPAETIRELTELRRSGVLTDAEFEDLSSGLSV
jgi:hypothetical protein